LRPSAAERVLLAPIADVWAFVSTAGRLPDWWRGVVAAQDHGDTWTIEGDERADTTRDSEISGRTGRQETVDVAKAAPTELALAFSRSGYRLRLTLEPTAANRTTARLELGQADPDETAAESLERVPRAGMPVGAAQPQALLDRLYELCQTGADG
jgi:uncharacterized protein YndB with AHSA1/START domain